MLIKCQSRGQITQRDIGYCWNSSKEILLTVGCFTIIYSSHVSLLIMFKLAFVTLMNITYLLTYTQK